MKDFNLFSVIGGTVGGVLAFMFGGFDLILYALIALVALDYVTGVAKGFYTKTISSEIGYKGLIKKVIIFIVVAVAVILQRVLGDAIPLREVTITFFICNEGISILENAAEFIPQRGDVFVRTSGLYGHIGIVISATKNYFYTVEQNYNGCGVVKNINHTDWSSINFLRPLNQKNINPENKVSFSKPLVWKNGSTPETVYADTAKKTKVGTLGKYETDECYAKANGMFLVSYKVDGTLDNKCGFVSYNGGC